MAAGGVTACVGGVFVLLTEFAAVPGAVRISAPAVPAPAPAHVPAGWFPDPPRVGPVSVIGVAARGRARSRCRAGLAGSARSCESSLPALGRVRSRSAQV
jgi:hypothetical protein